MLAKPLTTELGLLSGKNTSKIWNCNWRWSAVINEVPECRIWDNPLNQWLPQITDEHVRFHSAMGTGRCLSSKQMRDKRLSRIYFEERQYYLDHRYCYYHSLITITIMKLHRFGSWQSLALLAIGGFSSQMANKAEYVSAGAMATSRALM